MKNNENDIQIADCVDSYSITPVAAFILVSLLDMSLLATFGTLRDLLDFIFGWTMLCGIFGLPIASAHILLFGLPTFLLGWYIELFIGGLRLSWLLLLAPHLPPCSYLLGV